MITRTKAPQLDLLPIANLLRVAITPLHRHFAIGIRIHQYIERALAVELWEEGHRRCDLSEDRLDLGLDLCFCFFGCGRGGGGPVRSRGLAGGRN